MNLFVIREPFLCLVNLGLSLDLSFSVKKKNVKYTQKKKSAAVYYKKKKEKVHCVPFRFLLVHCVWVCQFSFGTHCVFVFLFVLVFMFESFSISLFFGFRVLVLGFVGVGVEVASIKESSTYSSVNPVLIIRRHGFGDGMLL